MRNILCMLLAAVLMTTAAPLAHAESLEGKPWVNSGLPGNLPAEKPGPEENYELYVNYDLYAGAAAVEKEDSSASRAEKALQDAMQSILEEGATPGARVLRRMTSLIQDRERREKEGSGPLEAYVKRVRETKSVEELSALLREEPIPVEILYADVSLNRSDGTPEVFAIQIASTDWIPLIDFPEGDEPPEEEIMQRDIPKVTEELTALGYTPEEARETAERINRFQEERSEFSMLQDAEDVPEDAPENAMMTLEEIREKCAPLYDQLVTQGWQAEGAVYMMYESGIMKFLQSKYTQENLDLFQALVCCGMLRYSRAYLEPAAWARLRELPGEPDLAEAAWEYLQHHIQSASEQAFAEFVLTPEKEKLIREMEDQYREAAVRQMQRCEWVSEESRAKLVEKASGMRFLTVSSEEKVDYAPLEEELKDESLNLLQAATLCDRFDRRQMAAMAGKPFDNGARVMFRSDTMMQADAVYQPSQNLVILFAGVLSPGMYDDSSREALMATLGQTIAHEISHGFDVRRLPYNASGEETGMLTPEDSARFVEKATAVMKHMDSIELMNGLHQSGQLVINEEMADLGGMRLNLDLAAEIEGFDYDIFFRALARKHYDLFPTREAAAGRYGYDEHPASFVRVNDLLAHFDEFYQTYPTVREGTPMYLAPEDRVTVW